MLYKEFFTDGKELFQTVFGGTATVDSLNDIFYELFDGQTLESMDIYATLNYGGRTMLEGIDSNNYISFITSIIYTHLQIWRIRHDAIYNEFSLLTGQTITDIKTGNISTSGTDSQTDTDSNKAFNEDEFNAREQHSTESSTQRKETYNEVKNVKTITPDGTDRLKSLELLNSRLYDLQKQMVWDIVSEITTDIYE